MGWDSPTGWDDPNRGWDASPLPTAPPPVGGDPGFPTGFNTSFATSNPTPPPDPDPPSPSPVPTPDRFTVDTVDRFTRILYLSLPDVYRDEDARQPAPLDRPLLRYLTGFGAQAEPVETAADRLTGPAGSQLTDPGLADVGWLAWLAQLVGGDLTGVDGEQARRDAVAYASSGWRAGTKTAVADAARSALTGTRYVKVDDHATATGAGTVWDVLLTTRTSETPDATLVLAAVTAKKAKPAGVRLHHRTFEVSWDAIETAYPTWDGWDAADWTTLQEAGL